jgi:hypothetical protein
MKKMLMALSLVSGALFLCAHAYAKRTSSNQEGYQAATVISVDKHVTPSNYVGDSPSDAPLAADDYSYDIGIRLNCNVYVGRYESAIDYLPSAFAPNHKVDVLVRKHVMYVSLPESDQEVKTGIVSHRLLKGALCAANN